MIVFRDTAEFSLEGPCAVTLGKFDGIHRGHLKLMKRIREQRARGLTSAVFALDARGGQRILTAKESEGVLRELGVEALVQCPFVPEIAGMEPDTFISRILEGAMKARFVAVGTDFRFGRNRQGDAAMLKERLESRGVTVEIEEKERYLGREISSTYVRECLEEGDMETAQALLGRPYFIEGTVVHGRHLGTSMGMPTLNLEPEERKLLPRRGVYMAVTTVQGRKIPGVCNVGVKPTVGADRPVAETYLFDTDGDLYGEDIRVELLHFQRPEQKFSSIEALKEQISKDISLGREYFCG